MNRPVKGVFFAATAALALGSLWTLYLLSQNEVDKLCAEELVTRLGELQLLLFVAFLALLPQAKDIRRTLSGHPTASVIFIVCVVLALVAPAFAMIGYFESDALVLSLGILAVVTLVANGALALDAIRNQGTPPPTIRQIGAEVDRVLTARAAAAGSPPAKKTWRVSIDGFGIKIEEQ